MAEEQEEQMEQTEKKEQWWGVIVEYMDDAADVLWFNTREEAEQVFVEEKKAAKEAVERCGEHEQQGPQVFLCKVLSEYLG